jgi:tetratricopeptide (TPR) repeat protein
MKRIVVTLFILLNFIVAFGQLKEYNSAVQYYKWGDLDKAKESIDKALTSEKTMNEPKTWYFKGLIYHGLYQSKDKSYKSLAPANCPDVVLEAYKKALLLDFKDPKYHNLDIENKDEDQVTFIKLINDDKTKVFDQEMFIDIIMNQFPSLANIFYNRGAKQYQDEKAYDKALKTFESSLFISSLSGKVDTAIIYFAALSAEKGNNLKKANSYYKQVAQYKYGRNDNERAYYWLVYANTYKSLNDTVNYLKALKSGIDKYPKANVNLLVEITNYYIKANKGKEALVYIKAAIQKDPKNVNLIFSEGTLYDRLDSTEKAIACYENAIQLDSTKIDPLYNLGICHFNKGVEFSKLASDEKDDNKYKELTSKSDSYFKKALPYFEKAHKLNPKDIDVISRLKESYYKLKMNDKYEATKKEIEGMKK